MQLCHNCELNFFLKHCVSHACSQVCPRPSGKVTSPVSSVLTGQHAGKCALSGACIYSLVPLYLRGLGGKEVAGVETSFCLRGHYKAQVPVKAISALEFLLSCDLQTHKHFQESCRLIQKSGVCRIQCNTYGLVFSSQFSNLWTLSGPVGVIVQKCCLKPCFQRGSKALVMHKLALCTGTNFNSYCTQECAYI